MEKGNFSEHRMIIPLLSETLAKIGPNKDFTEEEISNALQKVIDTMPETARIVLKHVKENAPETLANNHKDLLRFERHLLEIWSKPIDTFELFLDICMEIGIDFNERVPSKPENENLYSALSQLHARGCQVSREILVLLRSGYPDGAMARWRTLHEINITAIFLYEHGEILAKRYLDYDVVESKKALNAYKTCCDKLGYGPFGPEEEAKVVAAYNKACADYKSGFNNNYGWAAEVLTLTPIFRE